MAKTFRLEMVTPERVVFSEEISALVIPAHEGYLGVLAGHAPLVATLQPGEIKVTHDGKGRSFATSGGFLEVSKEKTILLSEAVEGVDQIDLARAEKARDRAKERLTNRPTDLDRARAEASFARAENRLKVARKRGR